MEDRVYKNIQTFLSEQAKEVDEYLNALGVYDYYLGKIMEHLQGDDFECFMSENEPLNTVDYVITMVDNYELPKGMYQIIPVDAYTRATDVMKKKLKELGFKDDGEFI